MGMKSCLGSLVLVVTIGAVALTAAYHAAVNSNLRFEPRHSQAEYINTRRSYRPPVQRQPKHTAPAATLQDDDIAEEVAP